MSEENNERPKLEKEEYLIAALTEAQSNIQHATADGRNPYFKSNYATLEQIITAVKTPLNEAGIYFQQVSHRVDDGACVETLFYGFGACISAGEVYIKADQQTPQAFGSALTYAKRYSLSLACGIGHQKDDDAEAAMNRGSSSAKVRQLNPKTEKEDPPASAGLFKLMNEKKTVIATADTTKEFLEHCRTHLANANSKTCQNIFEASSVDIQMCYRQSAGKDKESYKTLITLFGGSYE